MNKNTSVTLKLAATSDFASFGNAVIAYVRKVDDNGKTIYAIYSANGEQLAIEQSETSALQAIQQMNLFPVVVQ
ncbi:MAG: DUF1150 family protein [Proteobacteria bacterium]|nr:DUF1150 family protein [Pseudomonadota bacterium]